ncbi:MAG: VWA domain-containing protein, partial [Candidatus Limnocylindrales bacterium]
GDLRGLRDLMDRLRERRRDMLHQGQLADPLADVRRKLDEIVARERAGVQRRLDETEPGYEPPHGGVDPDPGAAGAWDADGSAHGAADGSADPWPATGPAPATDPQLQRMLRGIAAKRFDSLDSLPPDVGSRIRALGDYDFLDAEARREFEELVEKLRRSVLDRMSQGLSDAVKSMKPEDLDAQREMVRDLNGLLARRVQGEEPSQTDVDAFLAKHGAFFPGARTLDDVMDQLAQRMAAMQSLMRSLTPEQRAELQDTMDALLRDDRLKWDLAQLAANLDQLLPGGLGERVRFNGDQPLGLDAALGQLERLQALDALETQLDGADGPGDLGAIDRTEVEDLLGADAARDLDALEDLTNRLEDAGYLERTGDRMELTPRGHRRIGQKVLDELFARLQRDAFGGHRLDLAGRGGEREETSKPFEFGDPFHLDLRATMGNALMREENAPSRRAAGNAVKLRPDDFEVFRTERTTSASTVLLIDMSRSMLLRNCYLAAKKVAIALDTLIRTQYPRDHLAIVGFAYSARELRSEQLAELSWHTYEYGTNLQHGLLLARRILARQRSANKEIVVITDGEPTAHFEGGQVEFNYPPTRRTIQETLREVVRCTKEGITINTFMLERTPALTDFIGLVTELNRGRAFYAEPENLGEYVLVDFVQRRTKHVS